MDEELENNLGKFVNEELERNLGELVAEELSQQVVDNTRLCLHLAANLTRGIAPAQSNNQQRCAKISNVSDKLFTCFLLSLVDAELRFSTSSCFI